MADIKTIPANETEALFRDLDKPSLHGLSYALRHPDTWPEGFIWSFEHCGQCAMGLAHRLWNNIPMNDDMNRIKTGTSIMARNFKMPYSDAAEIFFGDAFTRRYCFGLIERKTPFSAVTPDMVADAIDKYLATAE